VRTYIGVGFALLLAGCGSAQATGTAVRQPTGTPVRQTTVTGVAASCAAVSPAQQFAAARLVFVGVMLPGPTTRLGSRPVLGSPARMHVERYLKGHGPRMVRVDTAVTIESDAIGVGEDGIEPRAGQRWKIYTQSRGQPFNTSICDGSRQAASPSQPSPSGRASLALLLWRRFPAQAKPRPIVPLGEGLVLAPANGFRTDAEKLAFLEGRFRRPPPPLLPGSVGNFGRFSEAPASVAYHRLRAAGVDEHHKVAPLVITGVHIGTATFLTDRGRMRLPAWQFSFKGVADPASVLALTPSDLFIPPRLHLAGPAGPGSSVEVSATISPPGKAVTLSFPGPPAGTGPCEANYRVSAVSSQHAVAFTITTVAAAIPPGQACPALAVIRTAVLHLDRPLGGRVLVSSADGGAIAVTPAG
jgi:hypothetical protein